MACENWDEATKQLARSFALEYTRITPEDKWAVIDTIKFVRKSLLAKGIKKSVPEVAAFVLQCKYLGLSPFLFIHVSSLQLIALWFGFVIQIDLELINF
jgi:hypothetical protein